MWPFWTTVLFHPFSHRETCSFRRLNDASRKTLLQAAREKPRKLAYHGKQLVPHSLISNAIVFYDMERMMWKIGKGEGEGDGERCKQRYKHLFFFCPTAACQGFFRTKWSTTEQHQMRLLISNAIVFYDMERMMWKIGKGEGEGDGERCKQRYKHLFFFCPTAACQGFFRTKWSTTEQHQMRLLLQNPGGTFLQIQTDI